MKQSKTIDNKDITNSLKTGERESATLDLLATLKPLGRKWLFSHYSGPSERSKELNIQERLLTLE